MSNEQITIISPSKYNLKNTITHNNTITNNTNKKLTVKLSSRNTRASNNRTSELDRGEHHFKIIYELLRAKLKLVAPIFYRHYRRKLLDKILREGRKMTKPASPGKSRTLKGQLAIPKYHNRLLLIRDDYLSRKSPQELFDWWSQKLDDYGMAAENWHFTWPEIECGFYNQLTHLSNSFNKYPPLEGEDGAREQELLAKYLSLVEQIIQTCLNPDPSPIPNYMLMMDAQAAYVRLTQMRHTGNPDCVVLGYFTEILEKTKDKPIILLPQSIFGKVEDFIKFYGIPVVPFLSVYKEVHGRGTPPCIQIDHDIGFHSDKYINLDLLALDYTQLENIKHEFNKRQQIINEILFIDNEKKNSETNLVNMFFNDIHERNYKSYIYDIYKSKSPSDFEEKLYEVYRWPEYIIRIDKILNKEPVKYDFSYSETNIEIATAFEKYIHMVADIIRQTR